MSIQVLTDSTSYVPKALRDELNIKVISLNVKFEDISFKEVNIDNNNFYKMMEQKGIPLSSQPSVGEMYDEMKDIIEAGNDIFCVFLSSDMSGTYSNANLVKKMILENYKDAHIEIVDSRSNSMQLGFAAIEAARAAAKGASLKEVKAATEANIKRSRFLFIPHNLVYLKKGGRIGGASALIGNILKIIPILTVENGVTTVLRKVRTKEKAIQAMIDKFMEDVTEFGLGEVIIHHINCYDEAESVAKILEEQLHTDVNIVDIGPVIGLHVGPGAIGIAYYTQKDMR